MNYLLLLCLVSGTTLAQTPTAPKPPKLSADSVKIIVQDLVRELALKHPGFYRYRTPAAYRQYVDSTLATLPDSLTELDSYRKLKPILAYMGCVHTGVELSEASQKQLKARPSLLPFRLHFQEGRAYISHLYQNSKTGPVLSPGTEVLAINNRPMKAILAQLLAAIPADGYNQTEKFLLLRHEFASWYRSVCEVTDSFRIRVRTGEGEKTVAVAAVADSVLSSAPERKPGPLSFERRGAVGIIRVPTFAKSVLKANKQDYNRFLKNTFQSLREQPVSHLILDLRYNTGGTDANAARLARYLMPTPFRYWDRIEVTEPIARSIKGKYRLFYRKPLRRDSAYVWRKSWVTREFDFYKPQSPDRRAFDGKLIVLINGLCLSACGDLAAVLAHNRRATFVGEETGGGYQGNNSGLIPTHRLATGSVVTVPLLNYWTAVDPNVGVGRGTLPDHPVQPALQQVIDGTDVELAYALQLCR